MNIKDVNRKNALRIIQWCFQQYGSSKFNKDVLTLKVQQKYKVDPNWYGAYEAETNTIFVFKKPIKSFIEFVATIIHEYQHYLQDDDMYEKYLEYRKSYHFHPYEIKAEKIAQRDKRKCIKELYSKKYGRYKQNNKPNKRIPSRIRIKYNATIRSK